MVVSSLNMCSANGVLNQSNLESAIHWRQSPQATTPETDQQNCILNFSDRDQRPSSPVQNGEENSCYSSENGADNLSPPQETSRSSGSEDLGVNSLFPISGCNMSHQCMDYSISDNESSQASPSSFHDDDSFRSGKHGSSSSGKPKLHKCRNCGFSTTNKHESWEHIATHMKPEKILRCPQCPFVTEYKHHLDFHMWNHQGVKPYKCDKCSYVCVNKSMLKSHLKSHSNVYQYRCANCSYRTKYCHSLKIHLRKYLHEPGMVLDPEGNPNPNPVIDVYGNRRGPKQKSKKHHVDNDTPIPATVTPALNAFQNFSWVNNVFFPENSRIPCPPSLLPNMITGSPFAPEPKTEIASQETDNLNNNVKIANINNNSSCSNNNNIYSDIDIKKDPSLDDDVVFQPRARRLEERSSVSPPPLPPPPPPQPTFYIPFEPKPSLLAVAPPQPEHVVVVEDAPLNLSVSHNAPMTGAFAHHQHHHETVTPAVKNRRKGVACKLKRTFAEDEEMAAQQVNCSRTSSERVPNTRSRDVADATTEVDNDVDNELLLAKLKTNKQNCFYCGFCEITFFNEIMFTMHMGYHGYLDPFTCNRCGKKTEDKIAFYAHMISSAHL